MGVLIFLGARSRAARTSLIDVRDFRRLVFLMALACRACRTVLAGMIVLAGLVARCRCVRAWCMRAGRRLRPADGLAGQLLDRSDSLAVGRRHDRDRSAGTSRAAGAADAMHIIVGVVRDVEVEDVADSRD